MVGLVGSLSVMKVYAAQTTGSGRSLSSARRAGPVSSTVQRSVTRWRGGARASSREALRHRPCARRGVFLCLTDVLDRQGVGQDGDRLPQCGYLGMGDEHRGGLTVASDLYVVLRGGHRGDPMNDREFFIDC